MTELPLSGQVKSRAGFVLVGGASSRMGCDKALIEFEGRSMAARIAECVQSVAGNVTLIGPPERYRTLGLTVIPDKVTGYGPIGGLYTALSTTRAEWNLIVACDMPFLTKHLLDSLFDDAESGPSTADCIIPTVTAEAGVKGGLEPLCAVYQRRCATTARRAIERNVLKMQDFLSMLRIRRHPVSDAAPLANFNLPTDWSAR